MQQSNLKFQKNLIIEGNIVTKTGLHIGGNKSELKIGGTDNPIITDHKGRPYIPGSSLKGKLRSLFEISEAKIEGGGRVHNCSKPDCPICVIFGSSANEQNGPTRLIVRDSFTDEDVETELKIENMINRIKGHAEHPRTMERVPPGTVFNLEMVYSIYDESDYGRLRKVFELLSMLEESYLGGSGSRGYGKVEIKGIKMRVKTLKDYAEGGPGSEVKLTSKDGEGLTPKEVIASFEELLKSIKA
ncbi:MAG: type III-A CRISPR-associated RAMP protein Csm3 [Candidatus Methanosuratincola petrocarbonis]